ncbi:MAG: hypothetical protein ABI867_01825 [Kofleriaceae bacterium]
MASCPICGCEWGGKGMPARCVCGYDYSAESMRAAIRKLRAARNWGAVQLVAGAGLFGSVLPFVRWAESGWVGIAIFVTPVMFAVGLAGIVRGGVKLVRSSRRLAAVHEMGQLPTARLR